MERWGDVVLVRPDPQAIWRPKSKWSKWDGYYHRSESGGGSWDFRRQLPKSWVIRYGELSLKISPTDFKHTGLFPEQAVNWDWYSDKIPQGPRRRRGSERAQSLRLHRGSHDRLRRRRGQCLPCRRLEGHGPVVPRERPRSPASPTSRSATSSTTA